jgi:hypothetical protein
MSEEESNKKNNNINEIKTIPKKADESTQEDEDINTVYSSIFENESKAASSGTAVETIPIPDDVISYFRGLNLNQEDKMGQGRVQVQVQEIKGDDSQTVDSMATQEISEGDGPLDYDAALKFLFERSANTAFLSKEADEPVENWSRPPSASSGSITISLNDLISERGQQSTPGSQQDGSESSPPVSTLDLSTVKTTDTGTVTPLPTARSDTGVSDFSASPRNTTREPYGSPQQVLFNSLQSIGQPDTTLMRGVAVKFADGEYRLFPKTADKGTKRVTFKKREDITNNRHCYSYKPRSEEAEYAKYFLKYFFSKHYERLQRVLTNEAFIKYTDVVIKDIHNDLPLTLNGVNLTLYTHLCFFIKETWNNDITRYDLVMMMIYFQIKSFFYDGKPETTPPIQEREWEWECKSKNCWEKVVIDIASILNSSPKFEKDRLIRQIAYVIKKNCPNVKEDKYLSRLINTVLTTYFFYYISEGTPGSVLSTPRTVDTATVASGRTQVTETSMSGLLFRAATKMAAARNKGESASIEQDPFGLFDDLSVQTFETPQYYTMGEDPRIDTLVKLLREGIQAGQTAEFDINFELIKAQMNIRTFKALKLLSAADLLRTNVIHYIFDKYESDTVTVTVGVKENDTKILTSFFNDMVNQNNVGTNGSKYDQILYPQLLKRLRDFINKHNDQLEIYKEIFKQYWLKYQVYIFGQKYLTLSAFELRRFNERGDRVNTVNDTLKTVASNEEIFYMMYDYIYYDCPKKLKGDKTFLIEFFKTTPKTGEQTGPKWSKPDNYGSIKPYPELTASTPESPPKNVVDYYINQGFFGDPAINLYVIPTDDKKLIVKDIVDNIESFDNGSTVQAHWNKLREITMQRSFESTQGIIGLLESTQKKVGGITNKPPAFFSTRKDYRPFPKKNPSKNKKRVTFKVI